MSTDFEGLHYQELIISINQPNSYSYEQSKHNMGFIAKNNYIIAYSYDISIHTSRELSAINSTMIVPVATTKSYPGLPASGYSILAWYVSFDIHTNTQYAPECIYTSRKQLKNSQKQFKSHKNSQ